MDMRRWFKGKNGMMVHWGLYSMLAGEYNGNRSSSYAEWIPSHQRIPNAEYSRLAGVFNPIYFKADEWVKLAKDAGFEYLVVTGKHHDTKTHGLHICNSLCAVLANGVGYSNKA